MTVRPFTLALAAVIAFLAWETWWLGPDARRVPLVVVLPLAALVGWQLWRERRVVEDRSAAERQPGGIVAIAWAAGLPVAIATFGMLAGPPLYVVAFMRRHGREGWRPALLLAAAVGALVWILFAVLLEQSLPRGIFG